MYPKHGLIALLAALASAPAAKSNIADDLVHRAFHRDVSAFTVTDFTPEGRKMPLATPAHPIFYEACSAGFKNWGVSVAGETPPPPKAVLAVIVRALAKQGYRPANAEHSPTLFLVFSWGTIRNSGKVYGPGPALAFLGGDKLGLMWETEQQYGGGYVDPRVWTRSLRNNLQSTVYDISQGDIYAALVRAYDFKATNEGKIEKLWETRMACPADGLGADEALPKLVKIAGPNIGRETNRPVWVDPNEKGTENIQIGEATVVDYDENAPVEIIDISNGSPAPSSLKKPQSK